MARQWYASPAFSATYSSHLLPASREARPGGARPALCGERRRQWRPVEEFSRPEAFPQCVRCVHLDAMEQRERAGL